MPSFKEMTQEEISSILDAVDESGNKLYQDVLTPLIEKEDRHFKNSSCPNCGAGSCIPTVSTRKPFSSDYPLPNKILRCVACSTEFDPYTLLIHSASIIAGSK
jgi:ribosomal protein S27AE